MGGKREKLPGRLRVPLDKFVLEMEKKLLENDHKGGWSFDSIASLTLRVKEEFDELRDAVLAHLASGDEATALNVVEEAADVANMVMMVADNVRSD